MNNQSIAHKSLNHHNTLPHHTAYARLIKSSTATRADCVDGVISVVMMVYVIYDVGSDTRSGRYGVHSNSHVHVLWLTI